MPFFRSVINLKCINCKKQIEDDSVFCRFCGAKQEKKKYSLKGSGSVSYLAQKNRYIARISRNGKQLYIGSYKSEREAWAAIKAAGVTDISGSYNLTVEQVYNKWSIGHFQTLTKNGEQGYKNAWHYFKDIKKLKMRDIKTSHIQCCIDNAAELHGRSVCEKVKSLGMQLCKYAMQEDIINKNYAEFVQLPPSADPETHPFTDDEIKILLENDNDRICRIILCMIFTGFRPTEFFSLEVKNIDIDNMFIRGGAKTEAGKNRIVPIYSGIQGYFKDFYNEAIQENRKYLLVNMRGNKIDVNNFRNRYFYKTLYKIGILKNEEDKHVTPYSTRHTFATLCDRADIDDDLLIRMIGHTTKKTTQIYIHKTEEDMKDAIESISKKTVF